MSIPTLTPGQTSLGWIGTGVMGKSIAGHLQQAGFSLNVYSRTREKTQTLLDAGARWQETPRKIAENSNVVFTMVGHPADVREVYFGEQGVLAGLRPGAIVVDLTTSEPELAQEIAQAARNQECYSLDAPVSGGDIGARNATLSIMVGGDEAVFSALKPCWDVIGKTVVYQGAAGSGQHTKMVNQILIATGMVGVCEALLYGQQAGLDLETVLKSVASGAAGSWSLSNYGPRMMAGDFDPGFFVEHFIKDMGIALAEARRLNLALPGLALAQQLYISLKAKGHGRDGIQALLLSLAEMSEVEWKTRS